MNKTDYKFIRKKLKFEFSRTRFFAQCALDVLCVATISWLFSSPFQIMNVFVIPLFMFRQFSVLHEAVHGLSHENPKVNQLVGVLSGFFCLTPFIAWKSAHLKHHYWTGNLENDPTFTIVKTYGQIPKNKRNLLEFGWRKSIPLLAILQHFGYFVYLIKLVSNFKRFSDYWLTVCLSGALISLLVSRATLPNTLITFVGIIFYFLLFESMIIPQHFGLCSANEPNLRLPVWEQDEISRSWRMHPLLEKFIFLNMNYHAEHHLFPDLPWHQLQYAHNIKKAVLKHQDGFSAANWMRVQRNRNFENVICAEPRKIKVRKTN